MRVANPNSMESFATLCLFALVGGVILNVMPCVLPVLGLKVYHLVNMSDQSASVKRKHGAAYSLGVLSMFWALAAIVIGMRAAGNRLGWGMQFQNPAFVAALMVVMVLFGLWALGVFELAIGTREVEAGEGYRGSFVKGLLAAVMATPCSAPFLGPAAAFALVQAHAVQTAIIFTLIGVGLAAPFFIISMVPAMAKLLPKPGAWMDSVKQMMGFTLLGAAVWLLGALQAQITASGVQQFVAFLLVMSIAVWATTRFAGFEHSNLRRRVVQSVALGLTVLAGYGLIDLQPAKKPAPLACNDQQQEPGVERPAVVDGKINWAPFNPKAVKTALDQGKPVFVDYTAEWCANCKTNEKLFIETEQIRKDLGETGILPMKADYTNEDETIEEWMTKLGRAAIPIYVVYYPDGSRDLLPEAINTDMLSKALRKAADKYPPKKAEKSARGEQPDAAAEDTRLAAR
jgi:thiol:disulfide interchange protein DsbD